MSKGVSRRRFLAGALGGGVSAALLTMFGSSPSYASDPTAAAMVAARVKQSLGGSAEGLGGKLPLGSALADLRKGWDGTVWAADRQGVPHTYDALAGEWKIFGNGFDVICRWDVHANTYFVTRGDQISVHGAAPQALTALWSGLPDTFAQGIDGAANVNGTIYLFRHGRYLAIDGSGKAGPAAVLRDTIANWPGKGTGNAWDQGAVTVVGCYSGSNPAGETRVLLWAGAEFVFLDMATKTVTDGPHSLEWYVGGQMYDGMKQGFTTMLWDETAYDVKAFNGPILWHTSNRNGDASASYANAYQASWVPLVTAAPAGVAGDLWAADRDGNVVHHDGADWQPAPPVVSKKAYHLAAGADGTVMALTSGGLERWTVQAAGSSWATVAGVNFAADRVTVGDADHVYLRATDNTARRWQTTGFTTLSLGHPAYDIAAGSDGTLWSAARDGRLYRYLTEGTAGSTSLDPGLPSGSVIIRVAATGFDSAYLLTEDAQAHQYRTPFVFKTSKAYFQAFSPWTAAAGMTATGHSLYLSTSRLTDAADQPDLVAIDTQTGLARWSYRLPESGAFASMPHVLDPVTNTIYLTDTWKIAGVDADTGAQTATIDLGSITTTNLGEPVVAGDTLYVGSVDGALIAVDVSDPSHLAVRWSIELGDRHVGYTPGAPTVDAAGQVYIVMHANGAGTRTASAVSTADGTLIWQKALAGVWNGNPDLPYDIVVGQRTAANASVPALFVNNAVAVACLVPGDGADLGSFAVPQPSSGTGIGISSGLVLRNNTLYFGDTSGRVFVVDALALTAHRMVETGSSPWGVIGRPALIPGTDPAAGDAVVAVTRGARQVYFVDPATGTVDTLATDQTAPAALSYDDAHGVLYAMAWHDTNEQADQIGQLFAIRPDSYVQDERSFIVESELMQDFGSEAEAAAAATTGGASRYQTHVTIVDGAKAPRPDMAVKLWADEDATVVAIDGQPFTIGPDTPAYFAADASGSFTITSDATDLATTTLRMWAAFMDEHERVAIIPDAAFHQRLARTTATGSADPDQIDLVSATDYQGKPLFAAGEKDQAGQAATAVTQLTGSTGIGAPTNLQAKAGDTDARYLTYPNTPGLDYSPVAVPVDRSVDSQDTAGIHLAAGGAVSVSPAQAASLLDDMSGTAVTLPGGILSTLRAAWHEIKTTAAKVEQVVISVAKDVLAGIQYVVDGVVKVVKVVVRDIKDAAAAVGAFFVQLGKDIVKVIQALGKLLALGEVVKTADMFKGWLTTTLTTGVPAMLTRARSLLSTWFAGAEQEVADTFCKLSTGLGLGGCGGTDSTPMKDRPNMGSTPSSIYGGAGANAVQAGWSTQTLRTQGGSDSDSASVSTQATGSDPIAALETVFETFLSDVSGDPTLSAQFANMKNAFGKAFTATSADQFFASALQGVVDLMSTVAVLSLSVTHALLDSFLAAAQTMMDAILGLGTANIPVLSSLYKAITGKTLSFLDLICFVLAFPVTYLFRALQGVFPSQAGTLQATAGTPKLSLEGKIVGLFTAAATIAAGVISSLISGAAAFRIPPPKPLLFGGAVLVVLGWVGVLFNAGWSQGTSGKFNDNLTVLGALSTVGTALAFVRPKTPVGKQALAVAVMGNSLITAIFSWKKYEDSQTTSAKEPGTTLTKEFFMVIPGVLAPLKFQPFPLKMIPPVCDLLFRWAAAAIILDQLITDWDAVTEPEPPTSTPPATSTAASTTRSTTTSTTRRSTTAAPTTRRSTTAAPITAVSSTTSGPVPPHGSSLANTGVDVPTLVGVGVTATAVGGFLALTARRNRIALERAGSDRPAHR